MATKTVAYYNEKLGKIHDQATALVNLAEKDGNRELTEEESAEFDGFIAESDEIKKTHLPRAQWREDEERRLAESRPLVGLQGGATITGSGEDGQFPAPTIVIPAAQMVGVNRLQSFRGEGAAERAYVVGRYYAAAIYGHLESRKWCDDHDIRAALSTDSAEKGGVVVPVQVSTAIIDLVEEYGTFRQGAERIVMASDVTTVPRVTGGLTAYFKAENTAATESEPDLDEIELIARKMMTLTRISNELNADAFISMGDLITRKIALAFAIKEDQCGWLGDGTSTYGAISGMITKCAAATATVVTALTANTAFSTLDLVDFESMIGKLPEFPGIMPEWYISKAGWAASMMRLADAAGGNTAMEIEGRRRQMFLGFPVNWVQPMNKVLTAQTSTSGLCYFGDLSMSSMFGQRLGVQIKTSEERYLEYDQIGIRGTERFAINVHDVGDTSNAGAMIMLSTPSS